MKKILIVTTIASSIVLCATPPSNSDILREIKPQTNTNSLKTIPSLSVKKFISPISDDKGIQVYVKDFVIEGNSVFSDEILSMVLSEYANKKLTISQLKAAASLITKYYRDQGYFVARAYVPAQKLKKENSHVKIHVIEGLYGNVSINNKSLLCDELAQGYLDVLKEKVISMKSLERQLLLLESLNGVKVINSEIQAGKEISQADFVLDLKEESKYNAYLVADNYGSVYTGTYRINAIASVNSLSKRADTLTLNTLSSNNQGLKHINLSYITPLGYDGFKINTSISRTNYEIGKEFESQNIQGDSISFNLGVSYPIVKQRVHEISTSVNYSYQKINDSSIRENKEKTLNSIKVSLDDILQTSYFNKPGLLNSSLYITMGNLSLDTVDSISNDTTLQSEGSYQKLNFSLSHTQVLNTLFSLQSSFKAQKTLGHKNLDGTEDFSISGAYGARSYNSSEASGDNGYLVSFNLFYSLPQYKKITHNVSTFLDHGKVWFDEDKSTTLNTRRLNSLGLAYAANYENLSFKTSFAHGFGTDKIPTSNSDDTNLNKLIFQVIARF